MRNHTAIVLVLVIAFPASAFQKIGIGQPDLLTW